jgi:glycerol-3-phosphate O-acyltransferase/dihydroxyacetone phosphate acyltransferase
MTRDRVPFSYRALQAWARSAIHVVYRRTEVVGMANLPRDRPAILAPNHSNALADMAVIVAKTQKFPRFLAAASWWKSAPARVLFRLAGAVPIHRTRDGIDTGQNLSTFEACYAALAAGAHIAIFPEGEMHTEPELMPLKTGAARIALGAATDAGVRGIVIVPVGLVYEDRGRFRSNVEIRFGDPIEIDEWVEQARCDQRNAARTVTDLLADRLGASIDRQAPVRAEPTGEERSRLALQLALLAPPAALGTIASAPIVLGAALASTQAKHESWKATTKGVAGTALCPLVWSFEYAYLRRRIGRGRAALLTAAGAAGGVAALAWHDRFDQYRGSV